MNSLKFTNAPPLNKRKPIKYGINNKGLLYNNVNIHIKPDLNKKNIKLETNISNITNKKFNNFLNKLDVTYVDDESEDTEFNILLVTIKTNVKKIINVYQSSYINGYATGFGDFIRGCYFLLQFCKSYNISYFIDLYNHPVSKFLENYKKTNKYYEPYKKYINKFDNTNHNPIIENNIILNNNDTNINYYFLTYLNNERKKYNNKECMIYIITFPCEFIEYEDRVIMQNILKPTYNLSLLVELKLTTLKLKKYNYNVIHIRYGDAFLINNNADIKTNHLFMLSNYIESLDSTKNYLLITDNIIIKYKLTKVYKFLKYLCEDITHTGEGVNIDNKKLENTMIDFYLMSFANKIDSFSVYEHGSGFSKWCAETYNIPYICRLIK